MMKTWMNHHAKRVCRNTGTLALLCLLLFAQLQAQAQTVEYIHTDALGSPIAVTDANGNVIERSEYAPYGDLLNRPDTDGPGYTGHVLDAATGLNYMQQRYYDPSIGIFVSVDPVAALSEPIISFNRYRYGAGNPYTFTDPDGRQAWCAASACNVVSMVQNLGRGAEAVSSKAEAINNKIEKVDVRLEGSIAMGPGLSGSVSLLRGDGDLGFVAVGEGADIGISLQPREPMKINLTDKRVHSPISFNGPLDIKAGAGLHGGVEVSFNPGGSLDVTPKVGVGAGEFAGYSPVIKFLEWQAPESVGN